MKKIYFFIPLFFLFLPAVVLAADERTAFHIFYERTFGIVGSIAGIIAMVALWQVSKKVADQTFKLALKLFVLVLFFINIGSISFGIHGAGILAGETSRYIERTCRLIALLLSDVLALVVFLRVVKKPATGEEKSKE